MDEKINEDISEEIQRTPEPVVTEDIAEKEEKIAKSVVEVPVSRDDLEIRKEKLINFLKKKKDWIYYLILSFIVFVGMLIRTRNIPGLKDITTGTWTLGPDLDPFLFLRWAKYIAEHGKLFLFDTMRYVPLTDICSGIQCNPVNTAGEMNLLSYLIAWLYKFLAIFSKDVTVTYAAIIFPVIMFGLTTVAFFLFARKIFYKQNKKIRNLIALVSTAFFVVIPSLLPRTIAGIPEKESAAFFFIFIAFYFFLEAFTSEKLKRGLIFGTLAGISTGLLGLIWGGVTYVIMTIAGAVLFSFILGKIDTKKMCSFGLWIISFAVILISFSTRYTLTSLFTSVSTGLVFLVFFILLFDFLLFKKKIFKISEKIRRKVPTPIISLVLAGILLVILSSVVFGISFIPGQISNVIDQTINPLAQSRFGVTVAENRQPYFVNDWKNNFGPVWKGIPVFFWLFFIGSVFLFNYMVKSLTKKEQGILTFGYILFLLGLVFSKYSSGSVLNGDTTLSFVVYFGGIIAFLGIFGYFYYKRHKEGGFSDFKGFEFSHILYFVVLTMAAIGARGAVRLIMVLGAVSPIAVGFLIVMSCKKYPRKGEDTKKFFIGIVVLLILLASIFTVWTYYQSDKRVAENYVPGTYQWQWQKAMSWVRENTQEDAVFAHWWDYGYWLQSIGERATILDGGNAIGYWNHLMGRHVLTGEDEIKALEFLYTHNGTHLLIDSTEIGKYTAFSSIGSNEDYDKFSWITTFLLDESQTQETKDEIIYFYPGGTMTDEDIIWEENGEDIILPRKNAALGGILLRRKPNGEIIGLEGVFMYNNNRHIIPLRFAYLGDTLYDFEIGLDAGVFLFPKLEQTSGGLNINEVGALLYLSERTIHSQLARLYLFEEESNYFKIAHVESNFLIEDLKNQGTDLGEFVYYQGIQGPIKIWEIEYPEGMKLNEEFLSTDYPEELRLIKPGEY